MIGVDSGNVNNLNLFVLIEKSNRHKRQLLHVFEEVRARSLDEEATAVNSAEETKAKSRANLWAIFPNPKMPQCILFVIKQGV